MALAQTYSDSMRRLSEAQTVDAKRVAMQEVISILRDPTITETIATEHIKLFRNVMKEDHRSKLTLAKSVAETIVLRKLSEAEAQDVENGVPVIVYSNDGSPYRMIFQRFDNRQYYRLKRNRLYDFWNDQQINVGDPFQVWLFCARDPSTNLLRFAITRVNQNAAP